MSDLIEQLDHCIARRGVGMYVKDAMVKARDEIAALQARIAELERRKPAESPWPSASGFPDP